MKWNEMKRVKKKGKAKAFKDWVKVSKSINLAKSKLYNLYILTNLSNTSFGKISQNPF